MVVKKWGSGFLSVSKQGSIFFLSHWGYKRKKGLYTIWKHTVLISHNICHVNIEFFENFFNWNSWMFLTKLWGGILNTKSLFFK